jgi:predicted protein tyrosine phosphatase
LPYPLLTICGLKEVATTIDRDFSYMLSILSIEDFVTTPAWIDKNNHLILRFEDISDPSLAHDQIYAPGKKDIEKIVLFGRKILAAQAQSLKPLELLIHCAAGRSRSPAAGYILLCDWYGPGTESKAADEIKEIAWHCWPNPYMIQLADQFLGRRGEMIRQAVFF